MRRYGMVIAIGLLMLVNAVVLGGVAYNRSGEPEAAVTLTERELPLSSYYGYADRENTGLSLRLSWSQAGSLSVFKFQQRRRQTQEWFGKAKLEAVGFDCSLPLDDRNAELHYSKMLPRKTFVVLEFEGKAWEAWQAKEQDDLAAMEQKVATGEVSKKQLESARKEYEREVRTRSRLLAVDVGNDPSALRLQYRDRRRFLILPATVRLFYHRPGDEGGDLKSPPRLEGSIGDILTDEVYVPKKHRSLLEKLLRRDGQQSGDYSPYTERKRDPTYAVTLRVGKRYEPWIAGVLPLAAGAAP